MDEQAKRVSDERARRRHFESAGMRYRPPSRKVRVYIDTADWWVGYYHGDTHHYLCLLPTVVIRWQRKGATRPFDHEAALNRVLEALNRIEHHDSIQPGAYGRASADAVTAVRRAIRAGRP